MNVTMNIYIPFLTYVLIGIMGKKKFHVTKVLYEGINNFKNILIDFY